MTQSHTNHSNVSIDDVLASVDGRLTPNEAHTLYSLASTLTSGTIVEIGSRKGRSTICLALALKHHNSKATIIAIDHFVGSSRHKESGEQIRTFDQFTENIKKFGVDDIITPLVKTSEEAAEGFDKQIDMLFIDAEHTYESVKKDVDLRAGNIVSGWYLCLHDTDRSWPDKVAKDHLFFSHYYCDTGRSDSISYGTRTTQQTIQQLQKNKRTYQQKKKQQRMKNIIKKLLPSKLILVLKRRLQK